MKTTVGHVSVAVAQIAERLTELLLRPRDVILKHKAPKSRYVHQLRRDVARGHAKPLHMALAISYEDVEDVAVPIGDVTRPYQDAIAMLVARRREIETSGVNAPSFLPLQIRESRAEERLNEAQLRVQESPDDEASLDELIQASAAYDGPQDHLVSAARERLASIRSRAARQLASA